MEQLLAWKKIAPGRLTIWDYYTDFRCYQMPFPNFNSFTHDIRMYADLGVKGIFAQGNSSGGGEFAELRAWVITQLLWNPDQDGWELVEEFVHNVYGQAAPYILSYIDLMHSRITPEFRLGIYDEPYGVNYLDTTYILKADSLFTLARKAAGTDSALLSRLEQAYLPIFWTKLYYSWQGGAFYISQAELPNAIRKFRALLDKFHVRKLTERPDKEGTIDDFLAEIWAFATMEFYTDWLVIGPFDNKDNQGLEKALPPEEEWNEDGIYIGVDDQQVTWKHYRNNITGYTDFNEAFGYSEYVVAYARKVITLKDAQMVKFGVGNNDGIRIWVNGRLEFEQPRAAIGPNKNYFSVSMKEGTLSILVKLDQLRHGWGFYLTRLE